MLSKKRIEELLRNHSHAIEGFVLNITEDKFDDLAEAIYKASNAQSEQTAQ